MSRTTERPLRHFRRARTLSQAQMASLLGVKQATWSRYESGKLTPPRHVKETIAAILGVSVNDCFPSDEVAA